MNPIGGLGGAERVLLAVLQSLRERMPDASVTVVTLSGGPLLDEAREHGAEAEVVEIAGGLQSFGESGAQGARLGRLLMAAPQLISAAYRLRRRIESRQPAIVHSFGLKTHLLMGLAPPRGTSIVWQVQDFYSARTISRSLVPWSTRRVAMALAVSSAVADDTRRLMPRLKVGVLENAIDLLQYTPHGDLDDLDSLAGMAPAASGTVRVGLVATYARWKGHLAFLEAARRVLDVAPAVSVRFYLVGSPIYATAGQFSRDELAAHARQLGIADRVAFVPFQPQTSQAYRALDVVVHASTQPEPYGLVIAEAMACGRAVVVSAAGGAADLFTDGVDALGHAPGDVAGLASAISKLVADPSLRSRLGRAAAETAAGRFGMQRYANQVEAYYHPLLKNAGSS